MTLNDLTISPSTVNFDGLLSDWDWVLNEPSKPVLLTVFGDAFIQGDSGRVYLIDACNGTLIDIAQCIDWAQSRGKEPDLLTFLRQLKTGMQSTVPPIAPNDYIVFCGNIISTFDPPFIRIIEVISKIKARKIDCIRVIIKDLNPISTFMIIRIFNRTGIRGHEFVNIQLCSEQRSRTQEQNPQESAVSYGFQRWHVKLNISQSIGLNVNNFTGLSQT